MLWLCNARILSRRVQEQGHERSPTSLVLRYTQGCAARDGRGVRGTRRNRCSTRQVQQQVQAARPALHATAADEPARPREYILIDAMEDRVRAARASTPEYILMDKIRCLMALDKRASMMTQLP